MFHERIGRGNIQARIRSLCWRLKQGLRDMPHVTLHTPMDPTLSAGIVSFEVAGISPAAVIDRLRARRIIASTTPYSPPYARLTPGIYNTPADIDAALAAIRTLA